MIRSPTGHKNMAVLETLSNDDVDALKKMNLNFTIEFPICLDLFSASMGHMTCPSLMCNASV